MGLGGGPGEARINVDQTGAILHGLCYIPKGSRVIVGRVGPDDQYAMAVGDVPPVIGHRPSAEGVRQTGDSGRMSDAGLVLNVDHAQGAQHLCQEIALLVVQGGTTQ